MPLHIPTHCPENWNAMSPTEQGRFCQNCQKEVVDFTALSLPAIKLYIEQHTDEWCGNFEEAQLEAFNTHYEVLPTPSRVRQWATAAVLTAVVTLPSFGQDTLPPSAVTPVRIHTPLSSNYVPYDEVSSAEEVTLSGRIWDPLQKQVVVTAILSVTGTEIIGSTDAQGYFSLQVPASEKTLVLVINHVSYGTNTYQIVPNQSRTNLLIELKAPVEEKAAIKDKVSKKKYKARRRFRPFRIFRKQRRMGTPIF